MRPCRIVVKFRRLPAENKLYRERCVWFVRRCQAARSIRKLPASFVPPLSARHFKRCLHRRRHSLFESPSNSDRAVPFPRNEFNFATIRERSWLLTRFLCGPNEKVNLNAHFSVVMQHLTMLGILSGSVLALPIEFVVRQKVVRVLVIRVHIFLCKCHQEEDMRRFYDEARIPIGWIKSKPKGWRNCLA